MRASGVVIGTDPEDPELRLCKKVLDLEGEVATSEGTLEA